jgi:hypothetical protein
MGSYWRLKTSAGAPALVITDALRQGVIQTAGTQHRTGLFRRTNPKGFHLAAIRAAIMQPIQVAPPMM